MATTEYFDETSRSRSRQNTKKFPEGELVMFRQENIKFYADSPGHLLMMLTLHLIVGYEIKDLWEDVRQFSDGTQIDYHVEMELRN